MGCIGHLVVYIAAELNYYACKIICTRIYSGSLALGIVYNSDVAGPALAAGGASDKV